MEIAAEFTSPRDEVEAITSSLARFERMRGSAGLVAVGAIALIAIVALPAAAAVAGIAGLVLMGALTLSWMRTARRASLSALAFTEPSSVAVADRGITVMREASTTELPWREVRHATKTRAGWIFVARRTGTAVVLPARLLNDAQAGELTGLLSSWPARRYRRSR